MTYDAHAIYFIIGAKSLQEHSSMLRFIQFFINDKSVEADHLLIVVLTQFVSFSLIGRPTDDSQVVHDEYIGSSQKASMVAFKDARKYREYKSL
ncbi:DUF3870 domain-containing protein [Sporolactobacillus shoreicorticis]|uniref:DUF3870 domain-containing protein n=1 Tax=Sporolactobacillus shoreicorticis TaxID=1923877 RepID=A0ABW5S6I7_9BACL|nr:DUF3870 domain-containing protein [Sporolactobacillus shoreicorticis]MCO7125705.1 DUF3870 domain-containing protein [Sporolactobacillus shoreicorticis]